jgi:hypothetical protein
MLKGTLNSNDIEVTLFGPEFEEDFTAKIYKAELIENVNSIPEVSLTLGTSNSSYFNKTLVGSYTVSVYNKLTNISNSYACVIDNYHLSPEGYEINLINSSEINHYDNRSIYLGNSLSNAFSILKFRKNVVNLKDISGEFYMINDTVDNTAIRLAKGSHKDCIFVINSDTIKFIDLKGLNYVDDIKEMPAYTTKYPIVYHRQIEDDFLIKSYEGGPENKFYAEAFKGKYYISNNSVNKDFIYNYVRSAKYLETPIKFSWYTTHSTPVNTEPGDIVASVNKELSSPIVMLLSKVSEYTSDSTKITCIWGVVNE